MADSSGASPDSEKAVRESISLYKGLLKEHPDDPKNARIYYQLARAQQNIGEPDAAIDTLKQLTDRLPDSQITGDAHFRRGELLFVRTRYAEAETEYPTVNRKSTRLNSSH